MPVGAEKRGLELVCQILGRLIVDCESLPQLREHAAARYQGLIPASAQTTGFDAARAWLQRQLATASGLPAEVIAGIIDVERDFFGDYERAFQSEIAIANASVSPASTSTEAFDSRALGQFLTEVFRTAVEVTALDTLALGFSKLTLKVGVRAADNVPRHLIVRMDRAFNYLGTTVVDEFPVLRAVQQHGVRVPYAHALESSGKVLGHPFMVVDQVEGRNLGSHFTAPAPNEAACTAMAEQLAALHGIPEVNLPRTLEGRNESAAEQLAAEIDRYYRDWVECQLVSPVIEVAFDWIKRNQARGVGERTLVHGDFSLSNVLIDGNDRVAAILDWEFARFAVPAADIGWFFFAAQGLTSWEHFLAAYRAAGGTVPPRAQLDFYVLWGVLKLAIMTSQLDAGIDSGRSKDLKHAYAASAFIRQITLRVADRLRAVL
jgi:aminoglycoside phosphotransferase (APT) family kinase protein